MDEQTLEPQSGVFRVARLEKDVAYAIHDAKNKLASLRLNLAYLEQATAPLSLPNDIRATISDLVQAEQSLEGLIHEALQASKGLAKEATHTRTTLSNLISGAIHGVRKVARDKDVTLSVQASLGVEIVCEASQIERVLQNILDNALRYSPAGGRIQCTVGMRAGYAYLSIEDEGPGIEPGMEETIFEDFYSQSTGKSNAGLGLGFCRRTVREHQGEIVARNRSGGGASFIIRLPLAVTAKAASGM